MYILHYCAHNGFKDVRETTLSFICFSAKRLFENKVCSVTIIRRWRRFHYCVEGVHGRADGLRAVRRKCRLQHFRLFAPPSLRHNPSFAVRIRDVPFSPNRSSPSRNRLQFNKMTVCMRYPRALTKYCPEFIGLLSSTGQTVGFVSFFHL